MKNLLGFFKKPHLLWGVALALLLVGGTVAYAALTCGGGMCYRSDPQTTITVTEYSTCVQNSNAAGSLYQYFIPVNTATEWNSFVNAVPGLAGLSLPSCAPSEGWAHKPDVPSVNGSFAGIAATGGKVYIIDGGWGTGQGKTYAYDPATNTWSVKATLTTPSSQEEIGAVALNGKIYAFGATTGGANRFSAVYDPVTNTWTSLALMPTARKEFAVVADTANNKIYAVGGSDSSGNPLATNEVYDPAANTWSAKASLPTARSFATAAMAGGKMYVIGGNFTGVNEAYDPATNTWSAKASAPAAIQEAMITDLGGLIYVVGGNTGVQPNKTNYVYNPSTNTWSTKLAHPLGGLGRATTNTSNGKIYATDWYSDQNGFYEYTP